MVFGAFCRGLQPFITITIIAVMMSCRSGLQCPAQVRIACADECCACTTMASEYDIKKRPPPMTSQHQPQPIKSGRQKQGHEGRMAHASPLRNRRICIRAEALSTMAVDNSQDVPPSKQGMSIRMER